MIETMISYGPEETNTATQRRGEARERCARGKMGENLPFLPSFLPLSPSLRSLSGLLSTVRYHKRDWGRVRLMPKGKNSLNFPLALALVVHFETAPNLFASPRQEKIYILFAVMAAKRFQARTEEEIQQFLWDKTRNLLTRRPTMQ